MLYGKDEEMKHAVRELAARKLPEPSAVLLSQLWLFAMLNTVFRDIHEMAKAETIEDILSGFMNGNPVNEAVLLLGGVLVELTLVMILGAYVFGPRLYRQLNLVLAPLAVLGVVFSAPNDPDDYFFVAITAVAFLSATAIAWSWRPKADVDRVARALARA